MSDQIEARDFSGPKGVGGSPDVVEKTASPIGFAAPPLSGDRAVTDRAGSDRDAVL
ncbi:hypothetical protein [Raineyella sp. LH-20]|uniref:hypothetical protein n=1 Tax=Raineyella sp. LH-20 TaxID=3081204 RepID=UPI00295408BE|nr:hypothetical protein [Raineyella sp. LH-20]WOP19318.1 hypothetical protein R0146_03330 [Raineyella sp. LH-20]